MSLKKFEILEMIAKGGMAEVYRAKTVGFSGFEKEVCVKKILPHLTEDKSFVDMFVNEAKLAATLNYANIVQVHDLCVSGEGEYFIVMEYVNGKDLSDVIRAAQLAGREVPPEIAVYVCRETCKGLHYAHSKQDPTGAPLNIIHRDVSPHNVLVSFMGEVKIVDFGIAKASSIMNKTAVGILKGKYGYMSPEQARGQPLDHRSDIFNTGIVLYELLVGERCFAGSSDFSTLNLMRNAEVTPPTKINGQIPADLERIVLRALSLKREDRFTDALGLESTLADFARVSGCNATASDLATFMQSLFADTRSDERGRTSTGVLSLASVVAPPAVEPDANGEAEPGSQALARAKRRATRSRNGSAQVARSAVASAHAPAPAGASVAAPAVDSESPPAPAETSDRPARARSVAKDDEAPAAADKAEPANKGSKKKDGPAKKEPAAKKAAPEKRPARLKSGPAGDDAGAAKSKKRKGKQLSDTPKKPVGRRDLRPGLTQLHRIRGGAHTRRLGLSAAIIVAFTLLGASVGWYRGRQVSRQTSFREMELAGREASSPRTISVYIDSTPRGAKVRFDGLDLAGRTPLAVERDRDRLVHQVRLSLPGHRAANRSMQYDSSPVTVLEVQLEGRPGRLEVDSRPSGLPVTIGKKEVGTTPLHHELPFGKHEISVGGHQGFAKVSRTVTVVANKTTKLDVDVPRANAIGQLDLRTQPRARIYVNGRPTRHWTNDGPIELAPDKPHRVGLRVRGAKDRPQIEVTLRKGEKRTIYLDLDTTRS